jgi:hypothetical protein
MIDQGWLHQVALPESQATGPGHKIIRTFCADLSLCGRGHAVYHEGRWWQVFCFAEKEHAQIFAQRFGSENSIQGKEGREGIGRNGISRMFMGLRK